MARGEQVVQSTFPLESRADNGLLPASLNRDGSPPGDHKYTRRARQLSSLGAIGESLVDLLVAICCAYFIVFAFLVYSRRNEPVARSGNQALLDAAKYNPTIFPILFAGVIGKFLKAVAAIKLENGTSILSLEYLLQSRTVLSTVTAPLTLRTVNLLTPFLFVLWALSPLGGQAGLRAISTQDAFTNATHNFTYLAYVSPFPNGGVNSASAESLVPTNAIFTSALISSNKSKTSPQDQNGNIKIPLYESLPSSPSAGDSDWRAVPDNGDFEWSSLTGLPLHSPPSVGVSKFNIETGYMVTNCSVSGQDWSDAYSRSLMNQSLWSGANYAFTQPTGSPFTVYNFSFLSLDLYGSDGVASAGKILTIANCTVTMRYVEVQIECDGPTCQSIAARPSKHPANHTGKFEVTGLDPTHYTPVNGAGQPNTFYLAFLADLTNATNPSVGCDTTFCPPSVLEAYLADPADTVLQGATTKLWKLGNELISQRFTQLFNTYWLDSVAAAPVSGNFSLDSLPGNTEAYNKDSVLGTITTREIVIKCDYTWLAILLVCSLVLFGIGLATVVLTALRRGPDVLDRFSSLLRDSRFVDIPQKSSMEDAVDQSRRLRNITVRLGDIRPEDDVGYIAIGVLDGSQPVQKLSKRRTYA